MSLTRVFSSSSFKTREYVNEKLALAVGGNNGHPMSQLLGSARLISAGQKAFFGSRNGRSLGNAESVAGSLSKKAPQYHISPCPLSFLASSDLTGFFPSRENPSLWLRVGPSFTSSISPYQAKKSDSSFSCFGIQSARFSSLRYQKVTPVSTQDPSIAPREPLIRPKRKPSYAFKHHRYLHYTPQTPESENLPDPLICIPTQSAAPQRPNADFVWSSSTNTFH